MNAIARTANAEPLAALTREQKFKIVIAALVAQGNKTFKAIHDIERMSAEELNSYPTAGTILQPVVNALNIHGVATDGTVGGVMRSLEFDPDDVHYVACWCHEENEVMTGIWAAERFVDLNNPRPVASTYSA